jgi:pimeloyl-ACP methyl ester carboxylesterase
MAQNAPLPIVLVTGQLLTADLWQPLCAHLPPALCHFADHQSDSDMAAFAQRLLANAPERFTLIGHAMGGFIAFEVMRQAPERVTNLVLIATLASADGPAQTARRHHYIDLVESGQFAQVVEERIPMLFPPEKRDDAALLGLARKMAQDTGAETFLQQQRAIMARPDSRPSLPHITCPTLLIWGDQDGITSRAHQQEILAGIAQAKLHIVEGAGHLPMVEASDAVAQQIRQFLGL